MILSGREGKKKKKRWTPSLSFYKTKDKGLEVYKQVRNLETEKAMIIDL